ncbi:MAG TPA: hypothetical protein VGH47_04315 [Xanthobacteraceae bacterium]|jgi:hypothetical protein
MDIARLIYEKGLRVGPDPAGHYVYLWSHDGVARYVGRGRENARGRPRWLAHATPKVNASNQPWRLYSEKHVREMSCSIVAEGRDDESAAADIEAAEIARHGLLKDETGTLLNDKRGSAFYGRVGKGQRTSTYPGHQEWVKIRNAGRFPLDAVLRRVVHGNPKKPGSPGAAYIELYPQPGETIIVREIYERGRAKGLTDAQQHNHLSWDLLHGFIEIVKPAP